MIEKVMGCVEITNNWLTEEQAQHIIKTVGDADREPNCHAKYKKADIGKNEDGGTYRSNYLMPITSNAHVDDGSPEYRTALKEGTVQHIENLRKIHELIGEKMKASVMDYIERYEFPIGFDEGYTILKYQSGQEYKAHCDYAPHIPRYLSALILLNPTEYEGGGTYFTHFDVNVKPETPSLVLFPSNYAYTHTALPVVSGTKYAIVTWLGHQIDFDGIPPMWLPNGENKYFDRAEFK